MEVDIDGEWIGADRWDDERDGKEGGRVGGQLNGPYINDKWLMCEETLGSESIKDPN